MFLRIDDRESTLKYGGGHAMKQAGVGLSKFLSYRMGKQGQVYKYDMSTYGDPT